MRRRASPGAPRGWQADSEICFYILYAELQGFDIGRNQLFLALKLFGKQVFAASLNSISSKVPKRAYINNVLEQLPLAGIGVFLVAHFHQRNAEIMDIVADKFFVQDFWCCRT